MSVARHLLSLGLFVPRWLNHQLVRNNYQHRKVGIKGLSIYSLNMILFLRYEVIIGVR